MLWMFKDNLKHYDINNSMTTALRYKDFDMNFKPHPVTGDLVKRTNEAAVIQALKNIIFLSFYEKPFHPNVGCGVSGLLFENITNVMSIHIQTTVVQAIKNFEPRAQNVQVSVNALPYQNSYNIGITFTVVNIQAPFSFNVILESVR